VNDFKKNFLDPSRHVAHVPEDVPKRRNFVLRLRPEPACTHPVRALRRLLKYALRRVRGMFRSRHLWVSEGNTISDRATIR
jgi:hypothetical protein